MAALATILGFPRVGPQRELKTALEKFWKGTISEQELWQTAESLQTQAWEWQREAGLDLVPVGDFSLYDHVLDTIELLGAIPERYQQREWTSPLARYFAMARGTTEQGGLPAMEMTKWFNTNYHYLVPEWTAGQTFQLNAGRLLGQVQRAQQLRLRPRPVLLGPVSLLLLGKPKTAGVDLSETLKNLLPVYVELLQELAAQQVEFVQLDEPCLVLELTDQEREWFRLASETLTAAVPQIHFTLTSYFDRLGNQLPLALSLPVQSVHLDLVAAPEQLETALTLLQKEGVASPKSLSLGLVSGRNVWKTDLKVALEQAQQAENVLGRDQISIASSCSLLHSPLDLNNEKQLDPEIKPWLSFAKQKLTEIAMIAKAVNYGADTIEDYLQENQQAIQSRRSSKRVVTSSVRERIQNLDADMYSRQSPFVTRAGIQQQQLQLPLLPTTTIGSFPQTTEIRKARAEFRRQKLSEVEYQTYLEEKTKECIRWQEEVGLDVLVHGEFERNDMVEYFGELLEGFLVTENGWVQSYGSRCVKPPIIFGDVFRPEPMTVDWTRFAQEQTDKIMKGMLTGPVTILFWSFVRDDQPLAETCQQIGLAIRDEVQDLEAAGIQIIQIDEPALREGLPLKRSDWQQYLEWAVNCFRLASSGVNDATQIHTHMCYSEFNDILASIAALDADVISIETSRSQMELLAGFADFHYPNAIGPGVYDIHSPRVPTKGEVTELIRKACQVIPKERIWINPDCGLKTRGWDEVRQALAVLVEAAHELRA